MLSVVSVDGPQNMLPEVFEDIKRRLPPTYLLEAAAPIEMWYEACKQAYRSPHLRHRTGCVIFDNNGIQAKGVAHQHDGSKKVISTHAEMDALAKGPLKNWPDCVVVTLTKCNNFAGTSKPCTDCARLLRKATVNRVIFAEKTNDGSWGIYSLDPDNLSDLKKTRYLDLY